MGEYRWGRFYGIHASLGGKFPGVLGDVCRVNTGRYRQLIAGVAAAVHIRRQVQRDESKAGIAAFWRVKADDVLAML